MQKSYVHKRKPFLYSRSALSVHTVKHPEKKMVCGSFRYKGVSSLRPVHEIINSQQYIEVLNEKEIPDLQKDYSNRPYIFQQDLVGSLSHVKKVMKRFQTCCTAVVSYYVINV